MVAFFKYFFAAIGVAVLLFVAVIIAFLWNGGYFKTLNPQFAGSCRPVLGEASVEDIVVDEAKGLAYLSAYDRLGSRGRPGLLGVVATYNLTTGEPQFQMNQADPPPGFHPHGMSHYKGQGVDRLFVISHINHSKDVIESFDIDEAGKLTHIETLEGTLLTSPNALAAVGPRQFYIANDNRSEDRMMQFLDNGFGIGTGNLVYFDGTSLKAVADVPYGSGIAVSADGGQLYYAATSKKKVMIFDRDQNSGALSHRADVPLGTSVDNIRVADDGALWVAGHANIIALISHFTSGGKENAPTQIFRIPMSGLDPEEPEEIYLNMGDEISAGSVAAPFGEGFLVGSITEKKFLICQPE